MSAGINILCYKSKTLANREHPLMVKVCKDEKKKYISLGISIDPKYWDFSKNRPKVNCPNKEQIEKLIIDKSKAYKDQIIELKAENKDFTPTSLIEKVDKPTKRLTAGELFLQQIDQLEKEERFPYAASYKQTYNSLIEYNRYKAGNYYRNKDEAFEFIRNCIHLRKIQLCMP